MTSKTRLTRSTALAVSLALPLLTAPVAAQQADASQEQPAASTDSAQTESMAEKIEQADAPDTAETDTAMTEALERQGAMDGNDSVVVTVGDAEISGSDILRAIGMLPANMRQQPAEMLLPVAVQQLVLRELILDRARTDNVSEEPAFSTMAEQASEDAREDAMVQFWLQRELSDAVTDEAVNAAYERITQNAQGAQGEIPPLEAVRPQIEQELRRRAMQRIRADLQAQGPEITFVDQDQQVDYTDGSFCTADYSPEDGSAEQASSEFAEMDLDGDGMVSQQEYRACRTAAAEK